MMALAAVLDQWRMGFGALIQYISWPKCRVFPSFCGMHVGLRAWGGWRLCQDPPRGLK